MLSTINETWSHIKLRTNSVPLHGITAAYMNTQLISLFNRVELI